MAAGRKARWGVPGLVALGVAAASAAPHALAANATPDLPSMTAAQLLAAVEQSQVRALSGTVETVAALGLPQMPDRLTAAVSGLPALLSGKHTLRVWGDGPDRQRVALLGDLSETDVVHNGADLWTYASSANAVTHRTLASHGPEDQAGSAPAAGADELTPQAQAEKALAAIDPSTVVTVADNVRVAGRPAYELVLLPRTAATLVRSVRIAIDAETSAPLRVDIYSAGPTLAWRTGFTDVSFAPPPAATFAFTPPAGATVTESGHPGAAEQGTAEQGTSEQGTAEKGTADKGVSQPDANEEHGPTSAGEGWATILELPAGSLDAAGLTGPDARGGRHGSWLDRLTTPVPEGHLLTSTLLSALVTADGRVFIGAVPADAVERAAAGNGG